MDLTSLLAPIAEFFQTGLGQVVGNVLRTLFALLYPSNAPAAHIEQP